MLWSRYPLMDPLRPFPEPPPETDPGARNAPFSVRFQSGSPLLGCLFALGALVIGGLLAIGAGVVVLLAPLALMAWRLLRKLLPGPPVEDFSRHGDASPDVIDVDSVLLPPEPEVKREPGTENR